MEATPSQSIMLCAMAADCVPQMTECNMNENKTSKSIIMDFEEIMKHAPQNRKNFDNLLKYCKSGQIVPFIGAGLSVFAKKIDGFNDKFLLWNDYLKYYGKKPEVDMYTAADMIEEKQGSEKFYKKICTTYGGNLSKSKWNVILNKAENEAISVIPKLFKGPIITTNFDQILEKIHTPEIDVYFPNNVEALKKLVVKERKHSIYKVHGSVSDVKTIIFTGKSYEEACKPDSELIKTLSDLYKAFNFLFLGSSLEMAKNKMDKSIKLWTQLTQTGMFHYAILECSKEKQDARREKLEKEHIYPIFYDEETTDHEKKHKAVKIILDELLTRVKDSYLKIPTYNSPFVERSFLADIENKLGTIATLNITEHKSAIAKTTLKGMGGIGKTRLACEYAIKHEKVYLSGMYFINAFSKENVLAQVYQFAFEKNLIDKEEKDQSVILEKSKKWMKDNDNWLFILDNVENYKDIEDLLQINGNELLNGKRHFIITSRKRYSELGDIELNVLNEDEANDFFYTQWKVLCL
ncbi:hypothetical protein FACS1894178_9100 [Bacteroidia bacterium]|nr:hypothetical protein FACS1894178_9100 [Bacteroidia bacterium]